MRHKFTVNTVDTDIKEKSIIIALTRDADPLSVNDDTIQVLKRSTKEVAEYKVEFVNRTLVLNLLKWPEPNEEYVLKIDKIKSILGEDLDVPVRKRISFESSVCSSINITSPSFNERLNKVTVEWEELFDEAVHEIGSYYLEISQSPNFYSLTAKTEVIGTTAYHVPILNPGQYFVRCRAQKDDQYGHWSEAISFIIGDNTGTEEWDDGENIFDDNDPEEDIFIDEIKIVSTPRDGDLQKTILIEFDCEIDSDFIDDIVIIRRDY